MSSRRSLIVLGALALISLAVVAVDRPERGHAVQSDRRLVPQYARAAVQGIRIERGGAPALRVETVEGSLVMTAPVKAALDQATLDDLLGTVEVATYRRASARVAAHGLDTPRAVVTIELAGRTVAISLGARVEGIDRVWVGRSGDKRAFLVDGHTARALDRTVDALRSRRVFFAHPEEVTAVELHARDKGLILSGVPLAIHGDAGAKVRMSGAAATKLLGLLDGLVLRRFVDDGDALPDPPLAAVSVRVIGSHPTRSLAEHGPCPGAEDLRLVETSAGRGCVRAAQLAAIAEFALDPKASYDRSLLGTQPITSMTVVAGTERIELRRWGAGWRFPDGRDADSAAVRALVRVLSIQSLEPFPVPADAPVLRRVVIEHGGETREILIQNTQRGLVMRRGGEPIAFPVTAAAAARVSARRFDYRSLALLAREPTSLVEAIARTGTRVGQHIVRGTLLEDWTVRAPAGRTASLELVRRLRQAGATLRARRFVAAKAAPAHGFRSPVRVVELQFEQPFAKGRPRVSHRIAIGARTKSGCFARVDEDPVVVELAREACAALTAKWSE